MGPDNSITVIGNMTRDPELKAVGGGTMLTTFSVAVNRRWLNRSTNEWDEQTSFFEVTCWRELAENVASSLAKGTRVVISGRLEQSTWQTAEGENRSKVQIVADDVAPSLRWATAEVRRNERSEGAGNPARVGGGREPAMAGVGVTALNEEPF